MIVGIGEHPRKQLEFLRAYFKDNPKVFVFPQFFDDKSALVTRKHRVYIKKLLLYRNKIRIAVWPDYMHSVPDVFLALEDIIWIYPLHEMEEISFVLRISDRFTIFLGFPNRPELRNYGLSRFISIAKEYSFRTWLLGLKSRYMRHLRLFDGCDVTPASSKKFRYKNLLNFNMLEEYARFIESLVNMS